MDFTPDEDVTAVRGLAHEIFADRATTERVADIERMETRVDEDLWRELAKAGLFGVALPENAGGAGLGLDALCVLLEEQGRVVAPVPVWPSIVAGLAIAVHGTPGQRDTVLPGVVDGSVRLTAAFEEFGPAPPDAPCCTARPSDDGWLLTGQKAVVPAAFGTEHVLISAGTERGAGLFLAATDAAGMDWERAETTNHEPAGNLTLRDVAAWPVGAPGSGVLDWALKRASVALAAVQLGVAQGALAHAVSYLSGREQFGRPLATFQAVAHQLADCYIDVDAMRVTLWQAISALEHGAHGEDGDRAVPVATWWAAEAGMNVVHRVQHVHGGIGVDTDYPVHRHFLWGKQISGTLGGAEATLELLGDVLTGRELAGGEVPR